MAYSMTGRIALPGPETPVELGIDPETLTVLTDARDRYGPLVEFRGGDGRCAVFVNSPAAVRQILVQNQAQYAKGPGFERVKMLLGNGIIVSDGAEWRRHRRMIQPAFTRRHVHRSAQMMRAVSRALADRWRVFATDRTPVDVTRETSEFALEVILRSLFGRDFENQVLAGGSNPFSFLSEDSTRDLRVVTRLRSLRALVQNIIDSRRAAGGADDDFLAALMAARDSDGVGFEDSEIIDEVMTFVVAGYETSAGTLNWAWYLLASNPDVRATLLREFESSDLDNWDWTADEVASLKFSRQVLQETLRLYPPVWLFTRRATEADEIERATVEAGTSLFISPYILQRTAVYWPGPDEFRPDRFAAGARSYDSEGVYIPFSLGPRRCIGEYYAFLEMQIHLATLVPLFTTEIVSDKPPDVELGINLRAADPIVHRISARR